MALNCIQHNHPKALPRQTQLNFGLVLFPICHISMDFTVSVTLPMILQSNSPQSSCLITQSADLNTLSMMMDFCKPHQRPLPFQIMRRWNISNLIKTTLNDDPPLQLYVSQPLMSFITNWLSMLSYHWASRGMSAALCQISSWCKWTAGSHLLLCTLLSQCHSLWRDIYFCYICLVS